MKVTDHSLATEFFKKNWPKLTYALPELPDIGHVVDGHPVIRVDRLKGEYWLEDGRKVVMPRLR